MACPQISLLIPAPEPWPRDSTAREAALSTVPTRKVPGWGRHRSLRRWRLAVASVLQS